MICWVLIKNVFSKLNHDGIFDLMDDFYNLMEKPIFEYAKAMHDEVKESLTALVSSTGDIDPNSLIEILRTYASKYSWFVTRYHLIKNRYMVAKNDFDELYNSYYSQVEAELGSKAKITTIKSKIMDEYGEFLGPLEQKVVDYETKYRLAGDHVEVFRTSISAIQSLSKLVSSEMIISRGGV